MGPHNDSAIENIKWKNAQNAARPEGDPSPLKGKGAIRADIQKADGKPPQQRQGRERVPENAQPKGKAGIQSDLYKAMQSEPQKPSPSRDGGRSR